MCDAKACMSEKYIKENTFLSFDQNTKNGREKCEIKWFSKSNESSWTVLRSRPTSGVEMKHFVQFYVETRFQCQMLCIGLFLKRIKY